MAGSGKPRKASGADARQRAALVEFCRVWGSRFGGDTPAAPPIQGKQPMPALGPRLRQTLELLLAGDGEKQIAGKLALSRHTVHDYVKDVYRRFGVSSRAELLSLWVRR
jgi:DNA-binding CsgD family transcriptional regulator